MRRWGTLILVLSMLSVAGCEIRSSGTPVVFRATRGTFRHEITTRGTVISEGGTEIRCQVDGVGPEGTMILEIVSEGSSVQPGDLLVQLDASALRDQLLHQQIQCNQLQADVIAAGSEYQKAAISLEEYTEALYPEEKKAIQNDIFAAEQAVLRARQKLEAAEESTSPAEGSAEDRDALQFDLEMAERGLDRAKARLEVLEKYTKERQVKQLEGDARSAEAQKRVKELELEAQLGRLARIEEQITACTITASSPGVVFYANVAGESEEDEILISEGVAVRQRQVILRLAQLDQLSVRIEVAESDIAHLRVDMPALVAVDTMPGEPFDGRVARIHPYPTQQTRGGEGKKKYEVHVAIVNPSGTLRPGLTAQVTVSVAELDDAIQVPATAVFEEGGSRYCLVRSNNRWLARPVVSGPSDGTMTVVSEGLEAEEEVAIHPLQHRRQTFQ